MKSGLRYVGQLLIKGRLLRVELSIALVPNKVVRSGVGPSDALSLAYHVHSCMINYSAYSMG
jgi:hypothetical protein